MQQHPSLVLDGDAHYLFEEFREEAEHRVTDGDLHDLSDWVVKLETSVVRLAAILQLASDEGGTEVTSTRMLEALEVGNYWIAHARAVHSMWVADDDLEAAKKVLVWVKRKNLCTFTLRDAEERQGLHQGARW